MKPEKISEFQSADPIEDVVVEASEKVAGDVEEELTPITIKEALLMVERVEADLRNNSYLKNKGADSGKSKLYYYSALKMAEDAVDLEAEAPSFSLGVSQGEDGVDADELDDHQTPEKQLSNIITRVKNSKTKRDRQQTDKMKEYKETKRRKTVKYLRTVKYLGVMKALNENEKDVVNCFINKDREAK